MSHERQQKKSNESSKVLGFSEEAEVRVHKASLLGPPTLNVLSGILIRTHFSIVGSISRLQGAHPSKI